MKNKWIGYVSPVLLVIAGVLQFIGNNILLGCLFFVCAVASVVIKIIIANKTKEGE